MNAVLSYATVLSTAVLVVATGIVWWLWSAPASAGRGSTRRVPAGLRRGPHEPWRVGLLVFEQDRLVYRRPVVLGSARTQQWRRSDLVVGIGRPLDGQDVAARLRGVRMISVSCQYGDESFDLAVSQARYTALRSWVEAVPPGWNANVA